MRKTCYKKHASVGMQADFDMGVQACKTHDEALATMHMLKSTARTRTPTLLSAKAEATETHARKVGHANSDYALLQRLSHKMQSLLPVTSWAASIKQQYRHQHSQTIVRQNTV